MPRISARHACTKEELDFCRKYAAFGETNAAEAYRRSFLVQDEFGDYFDPGPDGRPKDVSRPLKARDVSKRATALLKQEHVDRYIRELRKPGSDRAREVLEEQSFFGEDAHARRAAEQILANEDKLGLRRASEKWAEVMSDIGAEVVVPLPSKVSVDVYCSECGHFQQVEKKLDVSFPIGQMFPEHDAAAHRQDSEWSGEERSSS